MPHKYEEMTKHTPDFCDICKGSCYSNDNALRQARVREAMESTRFKGEGIPNDCAGSHNRACLCRYAK